MSALILAITRAQSTKQQEAQNTEPISNAQTLIPEGLSSTEEEEHSSDGEDIRETSVENITDQAEVQIILKDYHDSPFGVHFGTAKTYATIKRKFFWMGLKADIGRYIKNCHLVDRQHSTLKNYLRCFANDKPTDWDIIYLRTAAHA